MNVDFSVLQFLNFSNGVSISLAHPLPLVVASTWRNRVSGSVKRGRVRVAVKGGDEVCG